METYINRYEWIEIPEDDPYSDVMFDPDIQLPASDQTSYLFTKLNEYLREHKLICEEYMMERWDGRPVGIVTYSVCSHEQYNEIKTIFKINSNL